MREDVRYHEEVMHGGSRGEGRRGWMVLWRGGGGRPLEPGAVPLGAAVVLEISGLGARGRLGTLPVHSLAST